MIFLFVNICYKKLAYTEKCTNIKTIIINIKLKCNAKLVLLQFTIQTRETLIILITINILKNIYNIELIYM